MRELEKQIADWRRTMAKAASHRPELVDEFEGHLREEIDRLLKAGTSKETVFETAVSNLGAPSALVAEFDKLSAGRRAQWMPVKMARILSLALLVLLFAVLIRRLSAGSVEILLASHVASVTLGYGGLFIVGGLSLCYVCARFFGGPGPTQQASLRRAIFQFASTATVLAGIGTILGMFWAKENWGRYWAWDPKETGAVFVVGWGMVMSAMQWFKRVSLTTLVFMGILGNVITATAWFGGNTGHQFSGPLLAFILSQCAFLAAIIGSGLLKRYRAGA